MAAVGETEALKRKLMSRVPPSRTILEKSCSFSATGRKAFLTGRASGVPGLWLPGPGVVLSGC